jgi:molecular chaperone GrpE
MIQGQFLEILKRQGMEPIGVSPGEPFDPSRHEAVGEAAGDGPPGMVVEEVGKGYRLNGKVVRATKVIISKEQNK